MGQGCFGEGVDGLEAGGDISAVFDETCCGVVLLYWGFERVKVRVTIRLCADCGQDLDQETGECGTIIRNSL